MKKNIEENKSFIDGQKIDLTKNCEVIQKRHSNFLVEFNANHENFKKLKEQLKVPILGKVTQLFVSPDSFPNQNAKIERLKKQIIVLENTNEYMAYSLIKKETKIDQLNEKLEILNKL